MKVKKNDGRKKNLSAMGNRGSFKKSTQKVASVSIVILLIIALFSGCSSPEGSVNQFVSTSPSVATTAAINETVPIITTQPAQTVASQSSQTAASQSLATTVPQPDPTHASQPLAVAAAQSTAPGSSTATSTIAPATTAQNQTTVAPTTRRATTATPTTPRATTAKPTTQKSTTAATTQRPTTTATTKKPTTTAAEPQSSTVYITDTGTKFHRSGCRYLSKSKIPISRANAIKSGYTPCGVCKP